ncbi:ankyrin repeat protein [Colletotrichum plurivorum]|uniref:Ankyrin repeat protein n=1 Tax=Colletotrichum plurivorum TaxID=2175906 RepID=A0A8H6MXB2_9PEZI|nr:ankyrin repeat protein [Colletotrichum plurivorum]
MADPLSIAASIAGLVTLTDVVFDRLVKFRRSVKNAEEEIQDLCKEVNLLGGALNSLARLARALEDGSFDTNLRMQNIEDCSDILQEMDKKLRKLENSSMRQKLLWPFTKDRAKEWLDELSQHKANINLVLSANSLDAMMRLLAQEESHATEILAEVKETRKITSRIREDDRRRQVLNFFLRYNPQRNYDTSLRFRHPRTGLWLTRHPEFQHWLATPDSKLWLKGIPGAGKTVLAASIIEAALEKNTETTPTAFFFCDYKDTATQVVENILGTLAYQLAIQKEEAYRMLEQYYCELCPSTGLPRQASRRALNKLLGQMLALYDYAYLFIDGVDECGSSTAEVVEALFDVSNDANNVSIALLSRDEDEIRDRVEADFVTIEIAAHEGDVTEYVTAQIEERIRTRKLRVSGPNLKGEILQELVDGAKGMLNIPQLREVLSVPAPGTSLEAAAIVREEAITRYCSSLVRKSTEENRLEFSHFSVQEFLEKASLKDLGLDWIQVSRQRAYYLMAVECLKYIQLKNFDQPKIERERAEEQIKARDELYPLYQHASERWPIYAREEWGTQAVFDLGASLFHPLKTSYFTSWAIRFAFQFTDQYDYKELRVVIGILVGNYYKPLHMAATLSLPQICSFLVDEGAGVDLESPVGRPLQCAVQGVRLFNGRDQPSDHRWIIPELQRSQQQYAATADTIRCLCRAGASLDFRCCFPFSGMTLGQLSLQMVSQTGTFQILTALIQEGASVKESDILGAEKPFSRFWTASPEYEFNLQAFLEFLGSFNPQPPGYHRMSAMLWHHAISRKLSIASDPMKVDTRISLTMDELRKQAEAAAFAGNPQVLEIILRDPRSEAALFVNDNGRWLLDLALSYNHDATSDSVEVIDLLLKAGCDVTKTHRNGMDVLQEWCWSPTKDNGTPTDEELTHFDEVARLLAKAGASCAHQNLNGQNALHCHVKRPFLLNALLKYQAPESIQKAMKAVDNDGYTPLALSLWEKCTDAAAIFLSHKTPITMEMVQSPTPVLSLAVSANDETSFEALLLSGLNFRFEATQAPLHYLGYGAKLPFIHRLRSLYPEACAHQYNGHTPLESYLIRCLETKHRDVERLDTSFIDALSITDDLPNAEASKASVWFHFVSQIINNIRESPRGLTISEWRVEEISNLATTSLIRLGYLKSFESHFDTSGLVPILQPIDRLRHMRSVWPLTTSSICEVLGRTQHWSSLRQSPEIIRLLKAASESTELGLTRMMLEEGVSVHQRCDGSSALESVVTHPRSEEMFDLLLRYSDKSVLNETNPDKDRLALIHLTGTWSFEWAVRKLVGHGANPNLRVAKPPNQPALVYHIARGQTHCATATLENGADPTLFDDFGYDAALTAALKGHVVVLRGIYDAIKSGDKHDWHGKMDWRRRCLVRISIGATKQICTGVTALHLGAASQSTDILCFYGDHKLMEDVDILSDDGYTPLHFAASHGSVRNIQYLCARGCNVDARARDGSSPLHLAVRNNDEDSVGALINAGCKSFPDSYGMTPLEAVKRGDLQLCQRLVASGCDLETPLNDCIGGSLLVEALARKEVEIVEWMLQQKVSMITPISNSQSTELTIHLVLEEASLVDILSGSLENYMRYGGRLLGEAPPFATAAVRSDNVEGLMILLQHTRDNQDHYGKLWSMHPDEVVAFLVNEIGPSAEQTPLHVAAFDGNLIAAKLLLEWGAKVNPPGSSYQKTPLHDAIESLGDPLETVALLLIQEGADLESRDSWGRTPLNLAAENGRMRSLRALITAQANLYTTDEYSWTVLDNLAESDSLMRWTIFAELVRLGVDPHRVNSRGWSAFHDAADTSDTVSLLVNSDLIDLEDATPYPWNTIASVQLAAFISTAYPLFRKRYGRQVFQRFANLMPTGIESPLCRAAKQGSVLALEHLLELGASMDLEGCPFGSALMAACESGSLDGVEFLVRRGAALSYVGPNGLRSAYVSAQKSESILRWLLIDRFVDQQKLTDVPRYDRADNNMYSELFSWGGPVKVELVISGQMERLHHESSREYWSRLMEEKVGWRGKVVPLNTGRRTVFQSCLVPQEIVRVHPQGYRSSKDQKDQFSKKMAQWCQPLKTDGGCWYISYKDVPTDTSDDYGCPVTAKRPRQSSDLLESD